MLFYSMTFDYCAGMGMGTGMEMGQHGRGDEGMGLTLNGDGLGWIQNMLGWGQMVILMQLSN